jgi:hypothetical protein
MSAKIMEYKVGKFQLPQQAHVVHMEISLEPDEVLGLLKLEEEPLGPTPERRGQERPARAARRDGFPGCRGGPNNQLNTGGPRQ